MPKLTLYFSPGACSRVPLIALEIISENTDQDFETELVKFLKGDHKSEKFTRLNPASKIPVLVVDDTPIAQNIAILTWLHSQYPEAKLLPETDSTIEDANVLSLLARFPADLHPLVSRIRVPHFFCDLPEGRDRVYQMAVKAIREQLNPIERDLAKQTWLLGQQWSIIDAYLHWVWFRITGAGFDSSDFPNISAHYAKTLEIPAVKRALERESKAEEILESQGLSPSFLKQKPFKATS